MNQLATDYLKGRFYSGQITGEELMARVEAEVRRDVASEIEQIRGERDETAKELALLRTLHASEKQAKIERGEMLVEAQEALDWLEKHSYRDTPANPPAVYVIAHSSVWPAAVPNQLCAAVAAARSKS